CAPDRVGARQRRRALIVSCPYWRSRRRARGGGRGTTPARCYAATDMTTRVPGRNDKNATSRTGHPDRTALSSWARSRDARMELHMSLQKYLFAASALLACGAL